jgi:hypothetical protein
LNKLKYYFEALDLTYLSRLWRDGIGTFPSLRSGDKQRSEERFVNLSEAKGGCQGFIGPLPSAFLDKLLPDLVMNLHHQEGI